MALLRGGFTARVAPRLSTNFGTHFGWVRALSTQGHWPAGPRAYIELEDGTKLEGRSFGANKSVSGEVVFQTGMVGYPEALTDPSYAGQILSFTSPMVGNYGVPDTSLTDSNGIFVHAESDRIHTTGVIVTNYSEHYSHWNAVKSLGQWLQDEGVPGITGVDTRLITQKIRSRGSMLGRLVIEGTEEVELKDPNIHNLIAQVSTKEVLEYGVGNPLKILAVDCGIKHNILRQLVSRGAHVKLVPWDHDLSLEQEWCDGVFMSNGPGDPDHATVTVKNLQHYLQLEGSDIVPVFGICMGNQLVSQAAGATTFKLPFGNRGQNQPVIDTTTGQCFITPQNHGYAVDATKLPPDWVERFVNSNDGSNEGIMHTSKPFLTAQFHPEANGGPTDTEWMFDKFLHEVEVYSGKTGQGTLKSLDSTPLDFVKPDVKKVLILGSGGLSIGQAGEFDYSGSQAIKALNEEGVKVVLMNPNIASVQTNVDRSSSAQADNVYFLPINADYVEQVIKREAPDGILVSMGGQTGLNCGVELYRRGILDKYNLTVLGTPIESIIATEDRDIFDQKLKEIDEKMAMSFAVDTVHEALDAATKIGFPVMCRSAFALGGLGSGICKTPEELDEMATRAFGNGVPQVLVERSLEGWKEVEYEVVRDAADNCITVCNMENFDPLGVHTGDSIVVAPSQTLSNSEYHMLRRTAINVVRHLGIVGECNIQYALDPFSEDYCIIEVNARLSRSSALASKATGYPLAFVAAKLGLGLTLPEIKNSITQKTTACFEPALDYVVTKVPRWDLAKFEGVSTNIGSSMKSVGEVMGIGRTWEESMQKALRMVDGSIPGFQPMESMNIDNVEDLGNSIWPPSTTRIFSLAQALYEDTIDVEQMHDRTKIDYWFLRRLEGIANHAATVTKEAGGDVKAISPSNMLLAKKLGFSDSQIGKMAGANEDATRDARLAHDIRPVVKQIDTLAAEYPAFTNYLYTTYHGSSNDIDPPEAGSPDAIMVLGSGAYRIGSSVEFDWCSVSAIRTLRQNGFKTVMVNYNPETVSTDYDECDMLFFEELSKERIRDIYDMGGVGGVVVSVGGQIPNNLAMGLHVAGLPVLGTHPEMIDSAEDRYKFSMKMDSVGVKQPAWKELTTVSEAHAFADNVGYPVLVRPSYVLSGAAMAVAHDAPELEAFLANAAAVSSDYPVVITKFVLGAKEIELDAVGYEGKVIAASISEHVENAGVHSGDATLILPPKDVSAYQMAQVRTIANKMAQALDICGPFNVQFLAKGADVSVIECNLRASRSFPFVSKTVGVDFIQVATQAMIHRYNKNPSPPAVIENASLSKAGVYPEGYVGVKSPMFSYKRLLGADPVLGVEMASTGEVACFGANKYEAFLKSILSSGLSIPQKNILLSTQAEYTEQLVHSAHDLVDLGYNIYATRGTHAFLEEYNVPCTYLSYPSDTESTAPGVVETIKSGEIHMAIILKSASSATASDNFLIRRNAIDFSVPLITNLNLSMLFIDSLKHNAKNPMVGLQAENLFDYYKVEDPSEAWTDPTEFH